MNALLVAFHNRKGVENPSGGGLQPLINFIDEKPEIANWMIVFQTFVLVATEFTPPQLARVLRKQFRDSLFLVTRISADCDGLLPDRAWEFINNPRAAQSEPPKLS